LLRLDVVMRSFVKKNMSQQTQNTLLSPFMLGTLQLSNRVVMASLTRARATNPEIIPTQLHRRYYAQRASAGLIITESVWVSPDAIGFINIPGIFTSAQVGAWKKVTGAVQAKGGKIFLQLAHIGSASHPDYLNGRLPLGPSAINPGEKSFTPEGFKDTVTPQAYTVLQIKQTIAQYHQAAKNAKEASFDGIELHAQLFTLIPQFLSAATNQRTDEYGGSIAGRCRILFEILDSLIEVFPGKKVGVKFTPAAFNTGLIRPDESTLATFEYIFSRLNSYDLAFVELVRPAVDLSGTVLEALKDNFYGHFRKIFYGTLMANLGFDQQSAEEILRRGDADLVSFGSLFIANPDLVGRFFGSLPLAKADTATYYSGEEKGYTDYPEVNVVL
jgi:N-ethylmaleimide reductase